MIHLTNVYLYNKCIHLTNVITNGLKFSSLLCPTRLKNKIENNLT